MAESLLSSSSAFFSSLSLMSLFSLLLSASFRSVHFLRSFIFVSLLIPISRTLQQDLIPMIQSMPCFGFTQDERKAFIHSFHAMVWHFLYLLTQILRSLSGCSSAMEFGPDCMTQDIFLFFHPNLTMVHVLGDMKAGQSCNLATKSLVVSYSSVHNCRRGTWTFQG